MEESEIKKNEEIIFISSRKKWLWLGIFVALLNPVFAGLLLGAVYLSEPELKKEGRIIAAISILWGAALLYFVRHNLPAISLSL